MAIGAATTPGQQAQQSAGRGRGRGRPRCRTRRAQAAAASLCAGAVAAGAVRGWRAYVGLGSAGPVEEPTAADRAAARWHTPAAAQVLEQALSIYRYLGDRGGEAEALNARGTPHRVSGELAQAEGCHQQALDLACAIDSSWDKAHALAGLGRCALNGGHAMQAGVLLRQALEIFQRIGATEGADLLAELDALTDPPPAR